MLCFTGVSGAILGAAGQSVVDECKRCGNRADIYNITLGLIVSKNKIIEQHLDTCPCDFVNMNSTKHNVFSRPPGGWQGCAHWWWKPEL